VLALKLNVSLVSCVNNSSDVPHATCHLPPFSDAAAFSFIATGNGNGRVQPNVAWHRSMQQITANKIYTRTQKFQFQVKLGYIHAFIE